MKEMHRQLQLQQTREWMLSHKCIASEKYEQKILETNRMKKLMDGILRTEKPRRELAANLLITGPEDDLNTYKYIGDEIIYSNRPLKESSQILAHSQINGKSPIAEMFKLTNELMPDRVKAGISPITLLTEYRRKIILQAINNTGEIPSTKEQSIKKLEAYTQCHYPQFIPNDHDEKDDMDVKPDNTKIQSTSLDLGIVNNFSGTILQLGSDTSEYNSKANPSIDSSIRHSNSFNFSNNFRKQPETDHLSITTSSSMFLLEQVDKTKPLQPLPKSTKYIPEWKNYDIMKKRWNYIRPQLNAIDQELPNKDIIAPRSVTSKGIRINKSSVPLKGKYPDVVHFHNKSQKINNQIKNRKENLPSANTMTKTTTTATSNAEINSVDKLRYSPNHSSISKTSRSIKTAISQDNKNSNNNNSKIFSKTQSSALGQQQDDLLSIQMSSTFKEKQNIVVSSYKRGEYWPQITELPSSPTR